MVALTTQRAECNKYAKTVRRGFTLPELMVSIIIIGLIMAGSFAAINMYLRRARKGNTESTLRQLKQAIMLYQADTNTYPDKLNDLIKPPQNAKGWGGPYIEKKAVPTDGFGKKLIYKLTPNAKEPYELYSYGVLGKSGPKQGYISVWDL